jgi:hypothetical protein
VLLPCCLRVLCPRHPPRTALCIALLSVVRCRRLTAAAAAAAAQELGLDLEALGLPEVRQLGASPTLDLPALRGLPEMKLLPRRMTAPAHAPPLPPPPPPAVPDTSPRQLPEATTLPAPAPSPSPSPAPAPLIGTADVDSDEDDAAWAELSGSSAPPPPPPPPIPAASPQVLLEEEEDDAETMRKAEEVFRQLYGKPQVRQVHT